MTDWAAKAMGFKGDEAERSLRILEASGWPLDTLDVAMDLARFVNIPLGEATWALIMGPKALRRLGFKIPLRASQDEWLDIVRRETAGQAEAYTHTFYGQMDVREAQGHTFTRAFRALIESVFGKRSPYRWAVRSGAATRCVYCSSSSMSRD